MLESLLQASRGGPSLPSRTSQASLHRAPLEIPWLTGGRYFKVDFIRLKSPCSQQWLTWGSWVQALTAHRAVVGSLAWGRETLTGPVWMKWDGAMMGVPGPDSLPVSFARWPTKFDPGLCCLRCTRQALHCWLSLMGRGVCWEEILLLTAFMFSSMG